MMQGVFLDDFLIPVRLCSRLMCRLVTDAFDNMKFMPRTIKVSPLQSQIHSLQLVICDLSIVNFNLNHYIHEGWGESLAHWDIHIELRVAELHQESRQHLRDLVHLGQADRFTWRLLRFLIRGFWDDDAYDHIFSRRAQRSIDARLGVVMDGVDPDVFR